MTQDDYKKIEEIYEKRQIIATLSRKSNAKELVDFEIASSYIIADYERRIEELHAQLNDYNQYIINYLDSLKDEMRKKHGDVSKFSSILEDYAKQFICESERV